MFSEPVSGLHILNVKLLADDPGTEYWAITKLLLPKQQDFDRGVNIWPGERLYLQFWTERSLLGMLVQIKTYFGYDLSHGQNSGRVWQT